VSGGDWRSDVVDFWFSLSEEQWWRGSPDLDDSIRDRFLDLWKQKRELPPSAFLDDAATALPAILLFDQFPRNIFRGNAEQFATDPLALAIAKGAVDRDLDDKLPPERRKFLYMPFEHSETLDDQNRSMLLFSALGDDHMLGYAKKHRDIIARFGRFPHRNAMLGRTPRADELAAGEVVPW